MVTAGCIIRLFYFLFVQNDKGCQSFPLFIYVKHADINNTRAYCVYLLRVPDTTWLNFCVCFLVQEKHCVLEGNQTVVWPGFLYTQRPPRHLLNLPLLSRILPRRCVIWTLCVYTLHFSENWDFSRRVLCSLVLSCTYSPSTHEQVWKDQSVWMLIREW